MSRKCNPEKNFLLLLICGHDYDEREHANGVKKAVVEFFGEGNYMIDEDDWWVTKPDDFSKIIEEDTELLKSLM